MAKADQERIPWRRKTSQAGNPSSNSINRQWAKRRAKKRKEAKEAVNETGESPEETTAARESPTGIINGAIRKAISVLK